MAVSGTCLFARDSFHAAGTRHALNGGKPYVVIPVAGSVVDDKASNSLRGLRIRCAALVFLEASAEVATDGS